MTPSFSRISSRTRAASAWPRVAFMTPPTIAPMAWTLPPRGVSSIVTSAPAGIMTPLLPATFSETVAVKRAREMALLPYVQGQ